ncbi:MAG: hypothetical protein Q9209_002553 [Squamulea sp. 1 TL-2023]
MGTTVTIDKSYFETLLRRAEFHASGQDFSTPLNLPIVSIPKVDHDNLILIQGPRELDESAPALKGDMNGISNGQRPSHAVQISQPLVKEVEGRFFDIPHPATSPATGQHHDRHSPWVDNSFASSSHIGKEESVPLYASKSEDHLDRKNDRRTILLQNLPDVVTHKDIVNVVRGGPLLDIYLRPQDRSASVSFVDGSAAQDFLSYLKRSDVYIRGRRLSFEWSERQFYMPGHVASKLRVGATRNLVIRSVKPNITEQRLREDLDHIHNLIVISVAFEGGDVYLSLNSIHNALFARTCMMSRAMYRGMRIEWYPDECALPLPKMANTTRKEMVPPPKPKQAPMVNRFQMLNVDDDVTEDESSVGDAEDDTMTTGFSPLKGSRRNQWELSTVAAL